MKKKNKRVWKRFRIWSQSAHILCIHLIQQQIQIYLIIIDHNRETNIRSEANALQMSKKLQKDNLRKRVNNFDTVRTQFQKKTPLIWSNPNTASCLALLNLWICLHLMLNPDNQQNFIEIRIQNVWLLIWIIFFFL